MCVGRWYKFPVDNRAPMISTVKKLLASITTFLLTSMAGGATAHLHICNMCVGRWYKFPVDNRAPMISTVKKLLASITTFLLTSMAGGATAASRGANVF